MGNRNRLKIGLLGGSFNPAHAGHRHISIVALQRLGLDAVWWLVSPQNPLKSVASLATFADRLKTARIVANHPAIRVTDIENFMGTHFTVDSLRLICRRFPSTNFVWLMGADNFKQIPEWKRWRDIFRLLPVAIFARNPCSIRALTSKAAHYFTHRRQQANVTFANSLPPSWTFIHMQCHPASSTAIRQSSQFSERKG